ncbi:MAG: DUF5667 domain-containing protein [Patescibacteria group bacterium]
MFKTIKTVRQLKKLKKFPVNDQFLKLLKYRLEAYMALNPSQKSVIKSNSFLFAKSSFFPLTRLASLPLGIASALLIILTSGGAAFASQNSLPGEALYPVKKLTENTRLAITSNQESKVRLEVSFAAKRISEIEKLIEKNGPESEQIEPTVLAFEAHWLRAAELIKEKGDKGDSSSALVKNINDFLSANKESLNQTLKNYESLAEEKENDLKTQIIQAQQSSDDSKTNALIDDLIEIKSRKDLIKLKKKDFGDVFDDNSPKESIETESKAEEYSREYLLKEINNDYYDDDDDKYNNLNNDANDDIYISKENSNDDRDSDYDYSRERSRDIPDFENDTSSATSSTKKDSEVFSDKTDKNNENQAWLYKISEKEFNKLKEEYSYEKELEQEKETYRENY